MPKSEDSVPPFIDIPPTLEEYEKLVREEQSDNSSISETKNTEQPEPTTTWEVLFLKKK
jgi:hypothetical protein